MAADDIGTDGPSRDFWRGCYQSGDTSWDMGVPSPPFVALHQAGKIHPCKVVVPGCGRGWEVLWLAEQGYRVTAIDFAPEAIDHLQGALARRGLAAELICADLFDLPEHLSGRFELLLEQTCFCAIHPSRRADYVRATHRLLAPKGRLVGLFYACDNNDGPPYPTSPDEVRALFGGHFHVDELALTPHSQGNRQGKEWLGTLVRS